ncbi:MAG TPA: ABC transporter permease, partial [Candidatus Lustribacter sp.]|nr:ABC transporter permease [Candidatus Lustribacter sp.]
MKGRVLVESSRVEFLLWLRDPITLVFALALPVLNVAVLAGVFGDQPDPSGEVFRGVGGSTYYTPAYIALVAASVGLIAVPTQLAEYRDQGVLRRFRSAGLPVWAVLGGQIVVGLALSVVGAAFVVALSFIAYEPVGPDHPGGVAVAFLIGTVAFLMLGLMLGCLLPTARAAQDASALGGPPPEVLPDIMHTLGSLTPLHPMVVALQDPWFGDGWNTSMLAV